MLDSPPENPLLFRLFRYSFHGLWCTIMSWNWISRHRKSLYYACFGQVGTITIFLQLVPPIFWGTWMTVCKIWSIADISNMCFLLTWSFRESEVWDRKSGPVEINGGYQNKWYCKIKHCFRRKSYMACAYGVYIFQLMHVISIIISLIRRLLN